MPTKPKSTAWTLILCCAFSLLSSSFNLRAEETRYSLKTIKRIAKETAVVDLSPTAAKILESVPEDEKGRIAERVIRVFLKGRGLLAPNLVSAIAHAHPKLSVVVATEAIKLFPESAYSIAKAAAAAAPENAFLLNLLAVLENKEQTEAISAGVRHGSGEREKALVDLLTSLAQGERVESVAEAIVTVKFRIGGGRSNVPANGNRPELNTPGSNTPQEVFEGVTQQIIQEPVKDGQGNVVTDGAGNPILMPVLVVQIDTGNVEVPDDLTGQEIVDEFDVLLRSVLNVESNRFFGGIVLEAYVN